MNAGATFRFKDSSIDSHLWIVLSDPKTSVNDLILVSVTSWHDRADPSCRIDPGEHPQITVPSCISYFHSQCVTAADLRNNLDRKEIVVHESLSDELLDRVRTGARETDHICLDHMVILMDQGVV